MIRGDWVDPKAGTILLSEWLEQVTATKLDVTERTLATRQSLIDTHITPLLGVWPIGQITPEVLQRWVTDRSQHIAPATVAKTYRILTEAFTLAVARGRLARSPDIEVKLPRQTTPEHRYLTDSALQELAAAISPRYRPLVMLGGYGGLRPGEALAARWQDIDLEGRTIDVRGTKTAASRRRVRLPAIAVDALRQHRSDYPHVSVVIHTVQGNPTDINHLRNRQWADAVARSVGSPMRPYDLRHTHVGLLIAQGAHPKVIADRLGHTSIRTTMDVYGHLLEGVESDVVDRLGEPGVPQMAPKTAESPSPD